MSSYKCAFYGELRKDQYQYRSLVKKYGLYLIKYVETISLSGYVLYNFTNRLSPLCCRGRPYDRTVFDIIDIYNDEAMEEIQRMVKPNLYIEEVLEPVNDGFVSIYIYNKKPINCLEIIGGDYIQFKKNLNNVEEYL